MEKNRYAPATLPGGSAKFSGGSSPVNQLTSGEKVGLVVDEYRKYMGRITNLPCYDTPIHAITGPEGALSFIQRVQQSRYLDKNAKFCSPFGGALLAMLVNAATDAEATSYEIDDSIYREGVDSYHKLAESGAIDSGRVHLFCGNCSDADLKPYDIFHILPPLEDGSFVSIALMIVINGMKDGAVMYLAGFDLRNPSVRGLIPRMFLDVERDIQEIDSFGNTHLYRRTSSSPVEDIILPDKQDVLDKLHNPTLGTVYHAVISDFASDTDTIASALAEAYRINQAARSEGRNIITFPVIQGQLNDETLSVLQKIGIAPTDLILFPEVEDLLVSLEQRNATLRISLTDHSVIRAREGNPTLLNQKVVCIIEHHPISDTVQPKEAVFAKVGSTNTLVFERFQTSGIRIPPSLALLMLSAILSDTKNLAVNTTDRDKEAVRALREILDYSDKEQTDLFIAQTRALNTIDIPNPLEKIFNPDNLRHFPKTQPKFSFTTFRLNHGERDVFSKLQPEILGFILKDIQGRRLDVAFFNLTHLDEQGGLSNEPEELYVIGVPEMVLEYMQATRIPNRDRLEEIQVTSEGIRIYKLIHTGQAPRKKIVEEIMTTRSSSPVEEVTGDTLPIDSGSGLRLISRVSLLGPAVGLLGASVNTRGTMGRVFFNSPMDDRKRWLKLMFEPMINIR